MTRRIMIPLVALFVVSLLSTFGVLFGEEFSTNDLPEGAFTSLESEFGTWVAPEGSAAVIVPSNQNHRRSIHYWGNADQSLTLELKKPSEGVIILDVERWTSRPPFELIVEGRTGGQWKTVATLDAKTPTGFGKTYPLEFTGPTDALRFRLNAFEKLGVLIHGLTLIPNTPMEFVGAKLLQSRTEEPILLAEDGKERPAVLQTIDLETRGIQKRLSAESVTVSLKNAPILSKLEFLLNNRPLAVWENPSDGTKTVSLKDAGDAATLNALQNRLTVRAVGSKKATVTDRVALKIDDVTIGGKTVSFTEPAIDHLFGVLIRDSGWDGVSGYRIPGLTISNKGTLLAVYDIRHDNHNDLPGDIDIGLSRSFDSGKTWTPMTVAMNCHGADESKEGVGDPAILVDRATGRVWVAAVWAHNGRSTEDSAPGLGAETSGHLVLVYSDDDGETWSEPRSITAQAAPGRDWRILFQGPGMGITMRDGTLVFAAQFINKERVWFSTIVWSKDHGETWNVGNGARPGTCEAQVVELNDGSLMISMRNFKEYSRSIATTRDLGQTWTEHPTSLKALPDPICQASLLRLLSVKDGDARNLLAFCNPSSERGRINMTIQFSEDEGMTWDKPILLNKTPSYGYSCLVKIDSQTLGVLYETCGGLIFQQVKIPE